MVSALVLPLLSAAGLAAAASAPRAADPCAAIGGQKWVAPSAVRACFNAQALNQTEKSNILEVVSKSLASFHTSVNYQRLAPLPFTLDVHEDILGDLQKIDASKQANDYELHIAVSRAVKRLQDGHCTYQNYCYDSVYGTFLPLPLALLTDAKGAQAIHIAPEAFTVASAEFVDQIQFWQDALPGALKGKLASLSGATVLAIDGKDPWVAVNANAAISGSYQGFGQRQNLFFSTYARAAAGWSYSLGQFASKGLPLADSVKLKLQLVNATKPVEVEIPYRSRFTTGSVAFTDSASFRAGNCRAVEGTNGVNYYADANKKVISVGQGRPVPPAKKPLLNELVDASPAKDVTLPPALQPAAPALGDTKAVAAFYMLPDKKTGVLALGSFSGISFNDFQDTLLNGLKDLKAQGAARLLVDISSNGGGYICIAHFLHRVIVGPRASTVPNAGLYTTARASMLAKKITAKIAAGGDPDADLLYNPLGWRFANGTDMPAEYDWLKSGVKSKLVNLHPDAFSQTIQDQCQPFQTEPPAEGLWAPKDVVIMGNSRCASSCALFTITMAKEDGVKIVVVGGKSSVPQQYTGTVGGQSTDFVTVQSEAKSVGLGDDPLTPPDFLTNSYQGVTWRLGYGVWNKNEPEEWQNHLADVSFPLTAELWNKPQAIWTAVSKKMFK